MRHSLRILAVLLLAVAAAGSRAEAQAPAPGAFRLMEATIDDIHAAFRAKALTCRALVDGYLRRIEAYDRSGPRLNAVQTVNPRARQEADRLDAAFRAAGPVGPLHCIPVLVKDQVETTDMPTTYGSILFKEFVPQRDATVVAKLRQAGAVIIGKSTMGEYAAGYLSTAAGGGIRNAYDPKRNASGSSGGSGSGVAANFSTVAIAEDTGGSTRGPAAVNSLVGLRPTVPLVSRHGMMPARPSTDTLGPIARTVRDAALLLDVIAGYDPEDPITAQAVGQIPKTYTAFLTPDGLKGARLGVIRQPVDPKADPASEDYRKVKAVIDRAIADLRKLGAEVIDPVTIPDLAQRVNRAWDANVFETEPAVNRYLAEHPNAPFKTLRDILLSGNVVPSRVRVLMGNVGRSPEEAGYLQVVRANEELRQRVFSAMADQRLDALVHATFDHPPAEIGAGDMTNAQLDTTGLGSNRRLSPMLGFPALSVPAGFTSDGLPVGLEFLARPYAEPALFRLGYAYEQGTRHRRSPAATPALPGETAQAPAAEIKVLSGNGARNAIAELVAQFERTSGHRVTIRFEVNPHVQRKILEGEAFDVAILNPPVLDELITRGKVVSATRSVIGRSGIGVGIRTGAPKPDISTSAAFARTLLNAGSVAYPEEGASGKYFVSLLDRLGIAAQMKPKLRPMPGEYNVEIVADGKVDLVVVVASRIAGVPGVDLVGRIPQDLQTWIGFAGGVSAGAREPDAARALLRFLTSPAAALVLQAAGIEPFVE